MSINRIDFQGALARTADFSTIKQNEDNKGQVDQTNFQTQFSKEIDNKSNTVTEPKNTQQQQFKFDAREKGKNEYSGNGGKSRNKDTSEKKENGIFGPDGKKVSMDGTSTFDFKI
ncbi:MAG: hypothetical protein LKF52_11085 [Butyrivibrio sp.]|jgi:hypothetical protein|nr:hypothetical protein [Butyrivibrio sp.]